jgi:ribosomal protein S18 acetylase RimI-like enzyme
MSIIYRVLRLGEEDAVCRLIEESFNEFVAPEYSETGVKEFFKYSNPQSLKERAEKVHLVLLALDKNKLVGVIEIRSYNHISLLFVKTEYHNKGIAARLLKLSLESSRRANPLLDSVDVNSSPYAVDIYEKLGFERTGVEQEVNGIKFTPMKLILR